MDKYPYEFINDKQKVNCQLCGKGFISITATHLKTHNVTFLEYKLRFPEAPIKSPRSSFLNKSINNKILAIEEDAPINEIIDDERDIPKHNVNPVIHQEIAFDDKRNIPKHDVNPVIHQEIIFDDKQLSVNNSKSQDICNTSKDKILVYLKLFFKNIVKDYMIQEFSLSGHLSYEVITDFADPVLKLNIEFPNTFWHNAIFINNRLRNIRLEEYGWKVIEIKKISPSFKEIENILMSSTIYT